ncbi:MAG: Hpt domain-containing protein [Candidatus Sedimenticola sp. PURPLELP]
MDDIDVVIDADLSDLVPGYLAHRERDLSECWRMIDERNYCQIRRIGHNIKGSAGGFGFEKLSSIGKALERAAHKADQETIVFCLEELRNYLGHIKVHYR